MSNPTPTSAVLEAFRASADRVSTSLDTAFAPFLKQGEAMPDWRLGFELLGRLLEARAEQAKLGEILEPPPPVPGVSPAAADLKQALTGLVGKQWAEKLPLAAEMASEVGPEVATIGRAAAGWISSTLRATRSRVAAPPVTTPAAGEHPRPRPPAPLATPEAVVNTLREALLRWGGEDEGAKPASPGQLEALRSQVQSLATQVEALACQVQASAGRAAGPVEVAGR